MLARAQVYPGLGHSLPGLPAACVRHRQGSCDVSAVHFQMERGASIGGRHTKIKRIGSGGGDIDRKLGPLASRSPTDVEASTCVGSCLDIYAIGTIYIPCITRRGVMVRDSFATCVVVLGFDLAGNC